MGYLKKSEKRVKKMDKCPTQNNGCSDARLSKKMKKKNRKRKRKKRKEK
jgi:hypothetical protein